MPFDYNLVILAGGKSERFGRNKAIYPIDGIPMINRIILDVKNLKYLPETIYISIKNQKHIEEYVKVLKNDLILHKTSDNEYIMEYQNKINDLVSKSKKENVRIPIFFIFDKKDSNFKGNNAALIGIYSALDKIKNGFVHLIPCDTPLYNYKVINNIMEHFEPIKEKYEALIPRWINNYIEPLHSILRVEKFLPKIRKNIENKIFKLREIFPQSFNIYYFSIEENLREIDPELNMFRNLNRLEDIHKLKNNIREKKVQ